MCPLTSFPLVPLTSPGAVRLRFDSVAGVANLDSEGAPTVLRDPTTGRPPFPRELFNQYSNSPRRAVINKAGRSNPNICPHMSVSPSNEDHSRCIYVASVQQPLWLCALLMWRGVGFAFMYSVWFSWNWLGDCWTLDLTAARFGDASSARWRFGEVIEFGCVTAEGNDEGPRIGFVHGRGEARYHAEVVAFEGPSLTWWLNSLASPRMSSATGLGQSVSDRWRLLGNSRGNVISNFVDCWSLASQLVTDSSASPPSGGSRLVCRQKAAGAFPSWVAIDNESPSLDGLPGPHV